MDPHSADTITVHFRATQGQSGGENTYQPYIATQRVVSERLRRAHLSRWKVSQDTHTVIQSGLIPGGKDVKKGRHAVFFTAVNPMLIDPHRERDYDLTKSSIAVCKQNWKLHQNTVLSVKLEGCSEKRIAVLSKAIKHNHPLQHITCDVYRESGGQEVC